VQPGVAERCPAGNLRDHLADPRNTQVAARVPVGLHGRDQGQAQGQPGWLKGWFDFWINLQHPQVTFFAYLVAAAETLIAVVLITGFARKLTDISAAAFSVLIWATRRGVRRPPAARSISRSWTPSMRPAAARSSSRPPAAAMHGRSCVRR
jgi:hypothetical protein